VFFNSEEKSIIFKTINAMHFGRPFFQGAASESAYIIVGQHGLKNRAYMELDSRRKFIGPFSVHFNPKKNFGTFHPNIYG
jgi:hypothetical protein